LPDDSNVQIVLTADAGNTNTPCDEDSFPDQHIIEKMVRSASEMLARSGDGNNHTVAASLYADNGAIYNGMNLYHFTGGPCAEIVALARLVSESDGAKPLAIVAVADRERGVIAPCGRCRQILLDYCPEIQVVLKTEHGIRAMPLTAILPYVYLRADRPEIKRIV
jgi:cytidine deaminase